MALIAGVLLQGNAYALEQQSTKSGFANGVAVGFDLVVLRPLGFAALVVGAGAFVPAALMTAPNGKDSLTTALEVFVTTPLEDVFRRELGEF